MVFIVQNETEQPRKKLQIKRLKLNLPKGEYYAILSILLILLDFLSLILTRHTASVIDGILIFMIILYVHERETKKEEKSANTEADNKIEVINPPLS